MVQEDRNYLRDFRDLICDYTSYRSLDEMSREVLARLQKKFSAQAGNLFLGNTDTRKMYSKPLVGLGIDSVCYSKYVDYYIDIDPFNFYLRIPNKMVCTMSEIFPSYSSLGWREYFYDFLRPQKLYDEMDIYIRSGNKLLGLINLFCSKNRGCFQDKESILEARLLAPHIAAAMQNIILLNKIAHNVESPHDLSSLSSTGVILLNDDMEVIYYDAKAKEICLSIRGTEAMGEVELPVPREVMREALDFKESLKNSDRSTYNIRRKYIMCEGTRLRIEISVVRLSSEKAPVNCYMVYLDDLSDVDGNGEGTLGYEHHLTRREVQIAWSIADGLSNKQIAEKFYISRFTVDNHLRNIFYKLGVNNRTQLTGLVKSF